MSIRKHPPRPWPLLVLALTLGSGVAVGCGSSEPYFRANLTEMRLRESRDEPISPELQSEISNVLLSLFGDPDAPDIFAGQGVAAEAKAPLEAFGFDLAKLQLAAGPAFSDQTGKQHGLYRLHCAHCHGVSGDGNGPTAPFLNPYPRDYRQGKYKFKSTFGDAKPTDDDLKRILKDGIPGTAMPSFVLLPDNEIDALVEYVKYLSVRGETEIRLIEYVADEGEMPEGGIAEIAGGVPLQLDDDGLPEAEPEYENVVASILYKWAAAPTRIVQPVVPTVPLNSQSSGKDAEALAASIERGRKLFFSAETKCASCHGDAALGDGETTNFDDWTKAVFQPDANMQIEAAHAAEMLALGALPVRNIRPRNLRQGIYRGGRRPIDIYRRIFSGINGSPMPAQGSEAGIAGDNVSDDEAGGSVRRQKIWDLVNYVLSLPYEPLSQPPRPVEGYDITLR
ncbi:MAG: c-type cytochrome [Planctomycetales bacterium]|nr:c-type cytochrome [Planctomycetales bacterium]NIM09074.1 c-type cytochrome [Planctomycetales bacterium]NIN08532.1 c-type cytochrome [Planctomycetales bacterium]NIN77666.1 c-type cytochrome [Planctomycetales bacterium]NIO34832.1 c-type cytochrome [Planctomycetales bacterium]